MYEEIGTEIGNYLEQEFVCNHSHDLFQKIEYGCYNEVFQVIIVIAIVFVIVSFIHFLLKNILKN